MPGDQYGEKDPKGYTSFPVITTPENIQASKRISQKDILPNAIKNRLLGDIVGITNTASGTTTLNNGQDTTFTATVSNTQGAVIMAVADCSLYQTSVAAAQELPSGGSVDESQFYFAQLGPNNWNSTDNKNGVSKVYIRNISAGAATDVLIRIQYRTITNVPSS